MRFPRWGTLFSHEHVKSAAKQRAFTDLAAAAAPDRNRMSRCLEHSAS